MYYNEKTKKEKKMIRRYLVVVEGIVQGVGMRGFCTMQAQMRGLTGSVRNLANGMVEIQVQGEERTIDDFLSVIREGNRFIRVDDMHVKEIPVIENETRFTYTY